MLLNLEVKDCSVSNPSGLKSGPLTLPRDILAIIGELIAFGESDRYLHCVISGTGTYYGVFKSDDENHLYQHILRLNLVDIV